ncbi:MAG: hypothetical protein ACOCTT_03780 [archaeon]
MARHYTITKGVVYRNNLFDAVSDTGVNTSDSCLVAGARAVSVEFTAENVSSGNGVFSIEVSMDGGDSWTSYNMLVENTTNTNSEDITRVDEVTLDSNDSEMLFMDKSTLGGLTHVRVKVDVTTDGDYSADINICY